MQWSRAERKALGRELAGVVRGEVRFEDATRALYSTDASMYQVMPLGVVFPLDREDAVTAIRLCLEAGAPVLPRGGGTSLAGQCVGRAVVIDLSRHMDEILEIDPEARTARVQPGVVQAHLNAAAGAHGLMFGPDTATANRATLGGMVGNNSAGAHSILYRKTVDHVRTLDVVLSDGSEARLGEARLPALDELEGDGTLTQVQRVTHAVRANLEETILKRYPKIMRRVSGYNLDELLNGDTLNLARLVVGSEGSLAPVLEMEVDLVEAPKAIGLALVHFAGLHDAIAATTTILETGPSAVELMDDMLLGLAADHPTFERKLWFVGDDTQAVQLVEYFGADEAELAEKVRLLEDVMSRQEGARGVLRAKDAAQVADAWAIRKAGLPLLASIPTKRKPLPFVEDTAVDPEKLPEFVKRFKQIVDSHETKAAYYAHASAGCLHIRPLIDLHDPDDRQRMEDIAEAIFELVCEFGGSMSGEHGDGRARSHFNARLFGPEIYDGFQQVKKAFDPRNLFNPGQVVDGPAMGDDLRWDFTAHLDAPAPALSWPNQGGLNGALEACNGTAACRKVGTGTMCPTFMALRDEGQSTRGRANLLRSALSGAMPRDQLFGPEVSESLDLCLMCKACKSECPVKVDMAKLKTEWLAWRNLEHGTPLRARLLSRVRTWMDLGAWSPGLANLAARLPGAGAITEALLGFDRNRPLPELASTTAKAALARRPEPKEAPRGPAVLILDTFTQHLQPEVALDAARLLEDAGHEVVVPDLGCCGRPALGQGEVEVARGQVQAMVAALYPYANEDVPLIGVEPGCLSMLWDDAESLCPSPETEAVRDAVVLLDEHLLALTEDGWTPSFQEVGAEVGVHLHCHQEALGRADATMAMLAKVPGLTPRRLEGGCCGMAGDFGHTHLTASKAIFARTEAATHQGALCAPGSSCRKQMSDHGKQPLAPVTVLRHALDGERLPAPDPA